MSLEAVPPSTIEEVDDLLARGHAILFRTDDGEVGLRLYHREGYNKPIRTVDYPKVDMTLHWGHSDQRVSEWLTKYTVDVESDGGYTED